MAVIDKALLGLFIAVLMLVSYIIGTYYPSAVDTRLEGLEEVTCDDIIRSPYSDKFVCEVTLKDKDDKIKIFKEL
jgi:hypothetical protein